MNSPSRTRHPFNRDLLPNPARYYSPRLRRFKLGRPWATALCPFHDDHDPSLSVNLDHGGYHCHACGASGGDVLDFHRQLTGLDFKAAAQELGAWEVTP